MSDGDLSNRQSMSMTDMNSQASLSNVGDSERVITDLKKQVLTLQSENATLKRAVPRMKDIEGKDITDTVKKLADDLAMAEQSIEKWENKYAESEQALSRFQRKASDELDTKVLQIRDMKARAKALEEENDRLRKQAENDQSKIFHLQNDADTSEHQNLSMGEFESSFESENIPRLKQDLVEKTTENVKLSEQLTKLKQTVGDLQRQVEHSKAAKLGVTRDFDDSIFAFPQTSAINQAFTDVDYVVANMLGLLQQLDNNDRDANLLRENIVNFLKDQGYETEHKNVAELENTFRTAFNQRRDQIKRTNEELANEYRFGNTELGRQLNQLSDDSICSNVATSLQRATDPRASLSMDLGRNLAGMDILNKSVDVANDLGMVITRMNDLRSVCNQLFEKLRATAVFLADLLVNLEDSEEGQELMKKISDIKLDLDKSMGEARVLVEEVKKAEKSVSEFREFLGQTLDQTEQSQLQVSNAVDGNEVDELLRQEVDRLKGIEDQYESLKFSLNNELALKEVLNSNLIDMQKKLDDKQEAFDKELQELQSKLTEQESEAARLQEKIDDMDQVIEMKDDNLKEKDIEISVAENERQRLHKLLSDSKDTIEKIRAQINEMSAKYKNVVQAWNEQQLQLSEQQMQLDEKISQNAELEAKIRESNGLYNQATVESEDRIASIRKANLDLDKVNAGLQLKIQELEDNARKQNLILEKSNAVLTEKIAKGIQEKVTLDETIMEEQDDTEASISDFDEFTRFLVDCKNRSNSLVQLLKKCEDASESLVPYMQNMLSETRKIRLMLHRISIFFEEQKENLSRTNKSLGRQIRSELMKIYETLDSAAKQTHSSVLGSKANKGGAGFTGRR